MTNGSSGSRDETLSRVTSVVVEDALFFSLTGAEDLSEAFRELGGRRADAYLAVAHGVTIPRMLEQYEPWFFQMCRAVAPVAPPKWLPMMGVVEEKVTLEVGARGLRSLFSSKPSDKEVHRVRRLGSYAVRVLRSVLASDGALDVEEQRMIGAFLASIGLPEADASALYHEVALSASDLDPYGELDTPVARAIVRGMWLAAALDTLDPREEQVIRAVATKLGTNAEEFENGRAHVQKYVDMRRLAGLAIVDGIRHVLSDREPGTGIQLAAAVGTMVLPRRYRDEGLAHVGHGSPVTLAKRYASIPAAEKISVLGACWAAALYEDPNLSRTVLLRQRYERIAEDLGVEGDKVRMLVEEFVTDQVLKVAKAFR